MIDIAQIKVRAGNGGDGNVSFRREKFIPRGGPDGGDGGDGGSVFFVSSTNLVTLRDFRQKDLFKAEDGGHGGKKKMFGANGKDLYIAVPVGTLVYETRNGTEVLIGDMFEDGQKLMIAQGGRGGKGNFKFRSSTNQTPIQFVPGVRGEEKIIRLEIKLVADIGLIGAPNAGKSTLINRVTNANAKVANYPFTTLEPNLGILTFREGDTVILSDIPGIVEGAAEGKGLGDEFLRHVERTRFLLHLIDPLSFVDQTMPDNLDAKVLTTNAVNNYKMIREELVKYGHGLSEKPEIIVVNKIDITEVALALEDIKKGLKKAAGLKKGVEICGISAVSGEGLPKLMQTIEKLLLENPKKVVFETVKPTKIYTLENLPNKRMVFGDGGQGSVQNDTTKRI